MKKVALAVNEFNQLDHFGHCFKFNVYEVEENKIIKEFTIVNPEHKPGFLPKFLYDQGINVLISQNMGAMAAKIFEGLQIEVMYGVFGSSTEVIEGYLQETLNPSKESCKEHEEHHKDGFSHDHYHQNHS